jgi:putative exosortase-associated protein (TIGR04073 family)
MKKLISFFAIVFAGLIISKADIIYPDGTKPMPEPYALKKLSRGISNVVLAPLEIPKAGLDAGQEYGITDMRQVTDTITSGVYKSFRRLSSGVYDIATFIDDDKLPKYHLDPEFLSPLDAIPTYSYQFYWETLDTSAARTQ